MTAVGCKNLLARSIGILFLRRDTEVGLWVIKLPPLEVYIPSLISFSLFFLLRLSRIFYFVVDLVGTVRGLVSFILPNVANCGIILRSLNKVLHVLFRTASDLLDSGLSRNFG